MATFTPKELAEMAAADAEIERNFRITQEGFAMESMTTVLIVLGAATLTRWIMRGVLWLDSGNSEF